MADYQISARSNREIQVGEDGETVGWVRRGRWIQDLTGEVRRDVVKMKPPAPWRGFRYRLEQGGRELANAARPNARQHIVTFDVEMPGRKLQLVSQDRDGLAWLLLEGGSEVARYTQREFGEDDEWTADFVTREESAALAAFVAWLVVEARPFYRT